MRSPRFVRCVISPTTEFKDQSGLWTALAVLGEEGADIEEVELAFSGEVRGGFHLAVCSEEGADIEEVELSLSSEVRWTRVSNGLWENEVDEHWAVVRGQSRNGERIDRE